MDVPIISKAIRRYLRQFGPVILLAATLAPVIATPAAAQEPSGSAQPRPALGHNPTFTRITTEQGLSDIRVSDIIQDQAGFMWFGTQNGLNRFDGYNVVAYRHDPANPYSPSSNLISVLYEDHLGTLWVGTRSGLNAFDRRTERFTRYLNDPADSRSLSSNSVLAIKEDRSGVLWIGTTGGLNRFDPASGGFTVYRHNPANPHSLSNDTVRVIEEDSSGVLWIGTDGGLNRFDPSTSLKTSPANGSFTAYQHDETNPRSLSHNSVWDLYEDHTGVLWVATDGGGLNRFDQATGTFTQYRHDPQNPHSLSADRLDCLFEDASGALWIGTFGAGLSVLNPARQTFTTYRRDLTMPASLSDDYVSTIIANSSGLIWIATAGGGVNLYNPQGQAFIVYRHTPDAGNSLASDRVEALYEDRDGIIWVGTQDAGLNRFDRRSGQVTHYPPDPETPGRLGHPYVMALEQDQAGMLWVGTYGGGLYRLDPASGIFTAYRHDPANPHSLTDDAIFNLHADRSGALWIATRFGGLNRLDLKTGVFTAYRHDPNNPYSLSSDSLRAFDEDQHGNLWIGTLGGGLNRLDPATGQVTRYQHNPQNPASLSENNVWNIHFDRGGTLWVGTVGGGLDRLDPTTGIFTHYRERDGLASDRVVSILEDDAGGEGAAGNLWIATGRGLSRLDQERKTFHNYGTSDGLPLTDYNRGRFKTRSGELLFSSAQGLIAFDPAAIQNNSYVPPVVFTNFLLANQPVAIGQDSPLQQAIDETGTITLAYGERIVSFEFAALSYRLPRQNRYRYQLAGFDQGWTEVDATRRLATYTNLDPGAYVFRVTGSNSAGLWNETGRAITLIITPPWWETWWFRGLALALVIGVTFIAYRWRVSALKVQQRRLEALVTERTDELTAKNEALEVAKNQAETSNRAKSVFLAHMSHELRTPLTTILGYTQLMQHNLTANPAQATNLNAIARSGEHLLALIDDVLVMSRIEAGGTTLKTERVNLLNLLANLEAMIRLQAANRGLQFILKPAPGLPHFIEADGHKLQQVLLNLLRNAVKFTEQGSITLRVKKSIKDEGGRMKDRDFQPSAYTLLTFEVEDTGPGLSDEERTDLFQPFVQGQAGQKVRRGAGLGLAISREYVRMMGGELSVASDGVFGHGSTFSVNLPVIVLAEEPEEASTPLRRITGLAAGQPTGRLLVVEDDPDNRRWLVQLLAGTGFEVKEAENGQQAIDIWLEWQPQVILMDIGMPVLDGLEATQQIKARPGGLDTIIIATTASIFEEERQNILAVGCDDFLRKPFQEQAIFELLAKHLGVTYTYAAEQIIEPVRSEPPEVIAALAALPPAWLARLEQAVARSDVEEIGQVITQIRAKDDALAAMLATLAYNFEFQELLALLRATPP